MPAGKQCRPGRITSVRGVLTKTSPPETTLHLRAAKFSVDEGTGENINLSTIKHTPKKKNPFESGKELAALTQKDLWDATKVALR